MNKRLIPIIACVLIVGTVTACTKKTDTAKAALQTQTQENDAEWEPPSRLEDIDLTKVFRKEHHFVGWLGDNFQKIQVVFLTVNKTGANQYEVTGKSKAYDNICDFKGIIEAQSFEIIYEDFVSVTGKFRFEEDKNQSSTGIFEGTFSRSADELDHFTIFEGTWKSYTSGSTMKAVWSDVERILKDFGLPFRTSSEGYIVPPEEYRSRGWGLEIDYYPVFARQGKFDEGDELRKNWWKAKSPKTEYLIGETGPAKGIVFYDKGNNSGGWRYLEAAPVETEFRNVQWGTSQKIADIGTGIGTGKRNTELIVAHLNSQGETGRAAQVCADLSVNGFSDWFLPSADELDLMYQNLRENNIREYNIGGFTDGEYWSSSQDDYSYDGLGFALPQNFSNGRQEYSYGYYDFSVRAVRAF